MSEASQGLGWWQASDGKWYSPELHPDHQASAPLDQSAVSSSAIASDQVLVPADSAPVFAAADSAPVFAAADSAPVFAAADSAPVFAAADSAPVFVPADSAPVFAAADSAPVFAAADSAPVFAAADSAPVFVPADSAPVFLAADSAAPAFPAAAPDPVFAVANQSGPVAYPNVQYPDVPTSGNKSKTTAGVLAIFLGALGIHRFYMGYKLIGVIMLVITVASLGRLAPVTVLWGLVEGILIFTGKMKKDKYGGELT
jgi:TM2 domain-containing membrane protein YozV